MLLFISPSSAYLIDRKNNYYRQQSMSFKHESQKLDCTILDAELVLDEITGLSLLLFDCLLYNNILLVDTPYTKRLGYLQMFLKHQHGVKYPYLIALKKLELSYGLERIFKQMDKLGHKSDGVIFTCSTAPVSLVVIPVHFWYLRQDFKMEAK